MSLFLNYFFLFSLAEIRSEITPSLVQRREIQLKSPLYPLRLSRTYDSTSVSGKRISRFIFFRSNFRTFLSPSFRQFFSIYTFLHRFEKILFPRHFQFSRFFITCTFIRYLLYFTFKKTEVSLDFVRCFFLEGCRATGIQINRLFSRIRSGQTRSTRAAEGHLG